MATLLSGQALSKSFSARPLFREITFGISDGDQIGLIGPNGSGKSTLLRILAGLEKQDAGAVSRRTGLRLGYVPQDETFDADATIGGVLRAAIADEPLDETERALRVEAALAQTGFDDEGGADKVATTLSGGWRKRLSIARALITEPDLLLMDEPTNHLDLQGVVWLEDLLRIATFGYLLISHDRAFLENATKRTIELNAAYPNGFFASEGAYSDFLIKREEMLAGQAHQQVALASVVRREIEWLRRGAQARSTKAKGRIESALGKIDDLSDLKRRNAMVDAAVGGMTFSASGRQTKELVVMKGVSKALGGRTLFHDVEFQLTPGRRVGLVGENGSGKTTLLRLISGDLQADAGTIRRADKLKTVWFDQDRRSLETDVTLREALSPNSDTVDYRGGTMHVSAWAKRFLFRNEQLSLPVSLLSGGEKARVLIARLMLQPADLLILDEPTNDLDIPTLEVLEESLVTFPGAIVLVTHDRYLLDRVSTEVAGLMGDSTVRHYADYEQYEAGRKAHVKEAAKAQRAANAATAAAATPAPAVVRAAPVITAPKAAPTGPRPAALNSAERRELQGMEAKIEAAENKVAKWEAALVDPAVATDAARLKDAWDTLNDSREAVTALYARWQELEERQAASRG